MIPARLPSALWNDITCVWFNHIKQVQIMILYQSQRRIFRNSRWRPVAILDLLIFYMWHRGSSNTSNPTICWARNTFPALIKWFDVILMSKPRWLPISSYDNVKTFDEKYDNKIKVVSLFTYTIMVLCTNTPPSSATNPCARPSPYILLMIMMIIKMMNTLITWLQSDTLQLISISRYSGNKP